jgi:hypothetical protein
MLTDFSEVRTASIIRAIIALMMEAVRNPETSVNFYFTTRQYIPEDYKLHSRRRENLKSQRNGNIILNLLLLIISEKLSISFALLLSIFCLFKVS